MSKSCPDKDFLEKIFPPERTDAFFDALYGGAEEGAYDIALACREIKDDRAEFNFELRRRPGKCLVCSITYGLPQVFEKHPIINTAGVAQALADYLGWGKDFKWKLFPVVEINEDLEVIPLEIKRTKNA